MSDRRVHFSGPVIRAVAKVTGPLKRTLLVLLIVSGCTHHNSKIPTTAPLVLHMDDSMALQKLLRADEQPNLTHKLTLSRTGLIYFGALETYDNDEQVVTSAPIILRKTNGRWRGIRITDPRLKNT